LPKKSRRVLKSKRITYVNYDKKMDILYPPDLITTLKNKHLLFDTNFLRDAMSKPTPYKTFTNELRKYDVTLAVIDFVKYELLKGSSNVQKYEQREEFINSIADVTIPIIPDTYKTIYNLIQLYGINGAAVSITDLFMGALLMQYKKNIFLLTRDTSDFIQSIFDLVYVVNAPHSKGIFTYGVYQYQK
jgi:hypothetical protein